MLLVLQYTQQVDQECADLEGEICLLYCMLIAMCGMTTAMTNMHGYRRMFGVPHIHNQGQYETVKQMMLSTERKMGTQNSSGISRDLSLAKRYAVGSC